MPYHFLAVGVRAVHAMTNMSRLSQSQRNATLAGLHSVVNVMESRRLITATSSCFASVGLLFPFLPRGFPARWNLGNFGMSECRHALAHPTPPHQHSAALRVSRLVSPVEFRGDLWLQKTRVPGLSCGVVCYVILRLAVLVELRLVTDGQRDRQTQYRGCIASRGN